MGLSCKPEGKLRGLLAKLKNEEEKKRQIELMKNQKQPKDNE